MSTIESLLEERRGYVLRGLTNRVAQVDAELAKHGVGVEDIALETATVDTSEVEKATVRKGRR